MIVHFRAELAKTESRKKDSFTAGKKEEATGYRSDAHRAPSTSGRPCGDHSAGHPSGSPSSSPSCACAAAISRARRTCSAWDAFHAVDSGVGIDRNSEYRELRLLITLNILHIKSYIFLSAATGPTDVSPSLAAVALSAATSAPHAAGPPPPPTTTMGAATGAATGAAAGAAMSQRSSSAQKARNSPAASRAAIAGRTTLCRKAC